MTEIFKGLGHRIERVPIDSVIPYGRNARVHTEKQIAELADQIRAHGWTAPILVDENGVILAGHGRLLAARRLGLAEVPIVRITGLSPAQKRAVRIADNRLHDKSRFDKRMLKLELEDLALEDIALEATGLDTLEIDRILGMPDETQDEPRVDLPAEDVPVVSRVGDLWHIGEHRLSVSDARDPLAHERLLGGQLARLILTDPPYGCPIEGNVSGLGQVKHKNFVMGAGEVPLPVFAQTLLRPAFKAMAMHCAPGALAFVCTDWRAAPYLHDAAQGVFHEQKNLIVWVKSNAGMGTMYRSAHELIYLFKVSPGRHVNNFGLGEGGRHRSNTWFYEGANVFRKGRMEDLAAHSTVKPRKLCADAILDTSRRGDIVLDPFAGSGTTLAAAHITGRRGYGIELDPQYADVILRRVGEVVGAVPMLDGITPFEVVAATRGAEGEGA